MFGVVTPCKRTSMQGETGGEMELRLKSETNHIITCRYHNGPFFTTCMLQKSNVEVVAVCSKGCGAKARIANGMKNRAAVIRGQKGIGRILLIGPHPETAVNLRRTIVLDWVRSTLRSSVADSSSTSSTSTTSTTTSTTTTSQ